jgi:hypothetical protein
MAAERGGDVDFPVGLGKVGTVLAVFAGGEQC